MWIFVIYDVEYVSTSVMTIRVFSSALRVERSEQKWSSLAKKYFSSDQEILLGEIKNSLRSKIKLKFTQKTNLWEKKRQIL